MSELDEISKATDRINARFNSPTAPTAPAAPSPLQQKIAEFRKEYEALQPPIPTAPQEEIGILGALPKGLWKGATETLPVMIKQAGRASGILSTPNQEELKKEQTVLPPAPKYTSKAAEWLHQAGEMIPASLAPTIAGAAAGTTMGGPAGTVVGGIVGTVGGGSLFGMSQYQQTKEKALAKGMDPGWAPLGTGLIEGGFEALSNVIPILKLPGIKQSIKLAGKPFIKQLAKNIAEIGIGEVGTEMSQSYLEALIEKESGIDPNAQPWEQAKSVIAPTILMSIIMGGAISGANRLYGKNPAVPEKEKEKEINKEVDAVLPAPVYPSSPINILRPGTPQLSLPAPTNTGAINLLTGEMEGQKQLPGGQELLGLPAGQGFEMMPEDHLSYPPVPFRKDIINMGEAPARSGAAPVENLAGPNDPIRITNPEQYNLGRQQGIDGAAHQAATSPLNDLPQPTDAQKESGNYKKGHVRIQGLDIAIENPAGSDRSGVGPDGQPWTRTLQSHYGYIKGTVGRDKDHIDSFIGPNTESKNVFVVNQQDPKNGKFDEHKVMIGFNTLEEAKAAYQANYTEGWQGAKSVVPMTMDTFKTWVMQGNTRSEAATTMRSLADLKLTIGKEADVRQLGDKQVVFKDSKKADRAFFQERGIIYNETQGGWVVANRRLPELSSDLQKYYAPETGSGYAENIPGVTPNANKIQIEKSKRDFTRFLETADKTGEFVPGKVREFVQKNYPELAKKFEALLAKVQAKPTVSTQGKKNQMSLFPGIRAALKSIPKLAGTIGSDQRGIHYAPRKFKTLRGARNEDEASMYSKEIKQRMRQSTEYVESPTAIPGYLKSDLKKLGRYVGEVNATATPDIKSPGESWYKGGAIPHTIDISDYYDGNKDTRGFMKEVNKIVAANPQFHYRNVFANLIQQAGYPGYVMSVGEKTGERWAFGFGRIPVIQEDNRLKDALDSGKLKNIPFNPAPTGTTEKSKPGRTYQEASDTKAVNSHNTWIRQSADQDNSNRQLMVQFSTHLINKTDPAAEKDSSTKYYDALYSGSRPGYTRLHDFWEIPQWMGFASHFMPNADVYVIQDIKEAKKFLKGAGYDRILFSAIDMNTAFIKDLAASLPEVTFNVGGYTEKGTFNNIDNLKFYPSMEAFAKGNGFNYTEGTDYRHFAGSSVIPRLTMSQGCLHKCAFCVVEKKLVETPLDVILQQAESFKILDSGLVYLNDKTFGQAKNYTHLVEVNKIMKKNNPEFKGFIIQTTAASVNKMSDQFLKESGIQYIEIGVESYNDFILKGLHKPHNESIIDKAMEKIRAHNLKAIPNVIIGLQEETAETYARTQDFLERNKDIISHANIYNLALYKDSELGKKIVSDDANDLDENVLSKSFHTDKKLHEGFSETIYSFGQNLLTPAAPKEAKVSDKSKVRMTKEQVKATIEHITSKIVGELKVEVIDRNNNADLFNLPGAISKHLMKNITEGNNLLGLYDPDSKKIYLFSDAMGDRDQVQRILFHEMAHYGLDGILGRRYISTMNHVLLATNAADKGRLANLYYKKAFDKLTKSEQLLVAEERLAEMAESGEKPNVLKQVYAFIREALRAMGFDVTFSDADIRDLVNRAKQYAITGGPVLTDQVGDKIRDFRGALEYKEPGVTIHDSGEIEFDGDEGIVFVGSDHSNVNIKGVPNNANGVLYPVENLAWTTSAPLASRIIRFANRGYKTIAVVAYPDNLGSMQTAKYFDSAMKRAIIEAYGEKRAQSMFNQAKFILKNNPNKPYSQALAGVQNDEWLLKGKQRVNMKEVAQNISHANWQDMAGKIVGIGRYKEGTIQAPGQIDIWGWENKSSYPGIIKMSSYYVLPKPIDLIGLMSKSKSLSDKLKKSPWFQLRNLNISMHKSDSAVIPALMKAGMGDMSIINNLIEDEHGPGILQKDGSIKSAIKSVNPDVDAAWAGARGLKDKSAWEKVKDKVTELKSNIEHFKHYEKSWKGAEETLRTYENVSTYAANKTANFMAGITKKLKTRENQDLFERVVILRDLTNEASAGKLAETFKKTGELPFKYTSVDEMKADLVNFERQAAANAKVTEVLADRTMFFDELKTDMVKHGVLPEEILGNPDYFHHQVHIYNAMENYGSGLVSKDVRLHKQPWQRSGTGYSGAYNTNYFEAESKVMMSMVTQVETKKVLLSLGKDFQPVMDHVLNETRREAQALGVNEAKYIKENLKKNIEKYAPGHVAWQPERGNFMYRDTLSLTEKSMKKVMDLLGNVRAFETEMNMSEVLDLLDRFPNFNNEDLFVKKLSKLLNPQMGVSARDIVNWMKANPDAKRVLAIGEAKPFLVVPKSLAMQLDNFRALPETNVFAKLAYETQKRWKQWQLFNPARVVKYSFNNAIGDTDAVWAYRPGIILKYGKQAAIDSFNYVYGKKMSPALQEEFDYMAKKDIVGGGMTVYEIPDLTGDIWMKLFKDPKENIVSKYFGSMMHFNTFRENILRIAAFRYMRDEIKAGREAGLNHAASKADRIDSIPDPIDRAARMARELVGDYGNISFVGQSLRKYVIPFYSWMEINAPRYVRMMKNEIQADTKSGVTSRTLGVAGWGAAKLSLRMATYYTLVNMWNWTFFPDEDDEMRRLGRDQLHLILGRNDDGSVRSIRIQGAFSDALSWFGLENAPQDAEDLYTGHKTWSKMFEEVYKAPVNRTLQGAVPVYRGAAESLIGKSLYPDVFNPRPVRDKVQQLAKSFGVDFITNKIQQKPGEPWYKAFPQILFYKTDTGEAAYFYSMKKAFDWMEANNMQKPVSEPTKRSNALYYYKQAIKYGNKELADSYLEEFLKLGGKKTSIKQSISHANPLSVIPTSKRTKFLRSLDEDDKKAWTAAMQWWKDTYKAKHQMSQ